MRASALVLAASMVLAACSRPTASQGSPPSDAAPASATQPRYGALMAEIGRRFELAGRAANANRFDLAAFEVGEIQELFESELPRAELPKEGSTAALPALADAFAKTHPADLLKATHAKDGRAFAEAFQRASATCNGCHQASGHAFIQIPSAPGKSVPDLDPIASP